MSAPGMRPYYPGVECEHGWDACPRCDSAASAVAQAVERLRPIAAQMREACALEAQGHARAAMAGSNRAMICADGFAALASLCAALAGTRTSPLLALALVAPLALGAQRPRHAVNPPAPARLTGVAKESAGEVMPTPAVPLPYQTAWLVPRPVFVATAAAPTVAPTEAGRDWRPFLAAVPLGVAVFAIRRRHGHAPADTVAAPVVPAVVPEPGTGALVLPAAVLLVGAARISAAWADARIGGAR